VGYFVSRRMTVVMDNGEEMEFGRAVMPADHDAWIQPWTIDWHGTADYAKA
jgi:hypothetical protein